MDGILLVNHRILPGALGRFGGVLLLGLIAGCAMVDGSGGRATVDEPHEMFQRGFAKIEDIYIREEDLGELALAGLTKVASVDAKLAVMRQKDQLVVDFDG